MIINISPSQMKEQAMQFGHYDKPQYLLLNIAIGGDWGGRYGIDHTIFPQQMLIDYVRVYQKE